MARRRYISTDISTDTKVKKLASIGGPVAVLLYTWLIPHADDDGSITADPEELALRVFPGIRQITEDDISKHVDSIIAAGLMVKENGRLQFPLDSFLKHQTNISRDKAEYIAQGHSLKDWNAHRRNNYSNKKIVQSEIERSDFVQSETRTKLERNDLVQNEILRSDFVAPLPLPLPLPLPSPQPLKSTPLPPAGEDMPYQKIMDLWNEVCTPTYPAVTSLSDTRRRHIAARWKEHPDMEFWRTVFERLLTARHCLGDNDRGWKASFDFIFQNDDKYIKLMEGKYDRGTVTSPRGSPIRGDPNRGIVTDPSQLKGGYVEI